MDARRFGYWKILVAALLVGVFFAAGSLRVHWATAQGPVDMGKKVFMPVIVGPPNDSYVVIAWNDLGMHCYNRDFKDLAVLPPFNNLWAQVIKRGDPPQIVSDGITVSYSFPNNTESASKSNFWVYAPKLFNVTLPDNVGLAGKGLSGTMDKRSGSPGVYVAEGIPLTEFSDSAPTTPDPYQQAVVVVKDSGTGKVLATNDVVAPVSTEMHCDYCHADGMREGIATGVVEQNILTLHDRENGTNLMANRPVLCASCHASNALGPLGAGKPGMDNLSKVMHSAHDEVSTNKVSNLCYACHPGPETKCLRDVMSTNYNMTCTSCHGSMSQVADSNRNPWLQEPRCDGCHKEPKYQQNNPLYRLSTGHGGLYCEACHDSTHAIAQSSQPRDGQKFINLQGSPGTLSKCTVCHLTDPTGTSPHG